jgi:hypothetical protein
MKELDLPADIVNVDGGAICSRTRCAAMHCGVVSSRYA